MKHIAHVHTDCVSKFGIPRQSGLVSSLKGRVIFEREYRHPDVVRGLEGFSHIWLLWAFSANASDSWSPTVRPPRLGGDRRMGVFATRSPFRPNPIGLSSVRLERVEHTVDLGPVLHVLGIDMLHQTPVYDIKPYLAYTDSHPRATAGFLEQVSDRNLEVRIPPECIDAIPLELRDAVVGCLTQDPRPSYQDDPLRIYGFEFADLHIKFRVEDNVALVCSISRL